MKKKVEGWWELRGKRLEEQREVKVRRHLRSSGDQVSRNTNSLSKEEISESLFTSASGLAELER